jgi:hypothetical protein
VPDAAAMLFKVDMSSLPDPLPPLLLSNPINAYILAAGCGADVKVKVVPEIV